MKTLTEDCQILHRKSAGRLGSALPVEKVETLLSGDHQIRTDSLDSLLS
jgi:hypothetical protein